MVYEVVSDRLGPFCQLPPGSNRYLLGRSRGRVVTSLPSSPPLHRGCSALCGEVATTPAGGKGASEEGGISGDIPLLCVDGSTGIIDGSGAYSTSEDYRDDDDFVESALPTEQRLRLAHIWVANPSNAHQWTHGIGGVL